jgi:hypothetical protein
MNHPPGEHWMALLVSIWRHTPISIMLNGLMRPTGERRVRQLSRDRSDAAAPGTGGPAQLK